MTQRAQLVTVKKEDRSPTLGCRAVEVIGFAGFGKAGGGGLGGEVALRRSKELVADHEFANSGGAQQRRTIMRVQVPGFMRLPVGRPLMEAHGIRKSRFEEIVVANGDAAKDVAEKIALLLI